MTDGPRKQLKTKVLQAVEARQRQEEAEILKETTNLQHINTPEELQTAAYESSIVSRSREASHGALLEHFV